MAILKKKADVEKLNVPNEVMVYIATKIKSNISEFLTDNAPRTVQRSRCCLSAWQ